MTPAERVNVPPEDGWVRAEWMVVPVWRAGATTWETHVNNMTHAIHVFVDADADGESLARAMFESLPGTVATVGSESLLVEGAHFNIEYRFSRFP